MRSLPHELFPADVAAVVETLPPIELLVGIPTYRNAGTVEHVVRAVEVGLRKHFPGRRALLVVSDGHSDDGTVDRALAAGVGVDEAPLLLLDPASPRPLRLAWPYAGPSGKGSAFRSIFVLAAALQPKACAVFDADLRSVAPDWVDRLLGPVLAGRDYVTPVYARHKFDGTITNSIAYPLTAALYGRRLRQPIGGEVGFSARLAAAWADQPVWDSDVARYGVDIWMTTVALCEGFDVCQAHLGAKVHDPRDPATDLGPMFRQVVGSLYALAGKYPRHWLDVEQVADVPTYGFATVASAEEVPVSESRLIWKFVEGYVTHQPIWEQVLTAETYDGVMRAIARAGDHPDQGFALSAAAWVRVVYDYLIAYNMQAVDATKLMDSMIPLYFARTASFVAEQRSASAAAAEAAVSQYVDLFVQDKDYLRAQWFMQGQRRDLPEQPVRPDGAPLEPETLGKPV